MQRTCICDAEPHLTHYCLIKVGVVITISVARLKEVGKIRHSWGLVQLMGVARKRTGAQALQKESCVAYVETGTNIIVSYST